MYLRWVDPGLADDFCLGYPEWENTCRDPTTLKLHPSATAEACFSLTAASIANFLSWFQNCDIDLKFEMRGRIDTILMCVKFGDDPISSLDFSFIGGVHLRIDQINIYRKIGEGQIKVLS